MISLIILFIKSGFWDSISRIGALARQMADLIRVHPTVKILNDIVLNQVLVRFNDRSGHNSTARVIAAVQQGSVFVHQPVLPVSVVDTTGAGDSFDAGFVYGYLAGWPLERTLGMAMACGASSTQAAGGTASQPSLEEALALAG